METKRLVFIGVGGQGNLLASRLLGEAALSMNIPVVVSEIHGMAQRGGIVEIDQRYCWGMCRAPSSPASEADVLIGFEPLETLRALGKVQQGYGGHHQYPSPPPLYRGGGPGNLSEGGRNPSNFIRERAKRVIELDGNAIAEEVGNPLSLNMVMLGALIGSGTTPSVLKR